MKIYHLFLLLVVSTATLGQVTDASQTTNVNANIRNVTAPGGITKEAVADRFQDLINSKVSRGETIVASGTDSYTVTGNSTLAYTKNFLIVAKFTNANTGPSTININSLGAKAIKKNVTGALEAGDIIAGQIFLLIYDGTNFQLIGGSGGLLNTAAANELMKSDGDNAVPSGIFSTSAGNLSINGTSSGAAQVKLYEDTDDGTNYTAIKPGTQAADVTYTLPTATPGSNGYLLSSTTGGTLSWIPPAASPVWGAITGTLSDQTDLQAALDGKQDDIGTPVVANNNGSDFLSIGDTRENLGVVSDDIDVESQSGNYTFSAADFPGANDGQIKEIYATGSSPQTFTLPNDATLGVTKKVSVCGRVMGNSTLTFAATAPASIQSTSGGLLAPSSPFLWCLTRDAANHWVLDNSGAPLGSANQLLGVDNAGTGQEYKSVSNGLTSASGTVKLGGALTADTQLSGAFSFGVGVAPTAKVHVQGLGAGTASLFKLQNSTPVIKHHVLESGLTKSYAATSGASLTDYALRSVWSPSANSQTHTFYDLNVNTVTGGFTGLTQTYFQIRDSTNANPFMSISSGSGLIMDNQSTYNFRFGAGTAIVRADAGVLSLRGGIATGTRSLQFTTTATNATDAHVSYNFTGTTHTMSSNVVRTWTDLLIDIGTTSSNASATVNNTIIDITNTINSNSGILNQTGINYRPTLTAGTLTHYALRIQSGLSAFGHTSAPSAFVHIAPSTTVAGTASLKLGEGSRQTSAEDGTINYVANNLEFVETTTVYTLAKTLTATATLDFGSTAAGVATDLTITVTGAADGDAVTIGVPNGSTVANGVFTGWVSAANTVKIRFANTNLVTTLDPASGTFRAVVIKY